MEAIILSTQVKREYEYKVFEKGHLKQFVLKLTQVCNVLPSDGSIFLHYKENEFVTSKKATMDEIESLCEIDHPLDSLSFHCKQNIISLSRFSKGLSVSYVIDGNVEYSKMFIFFVETTLELTRIGEQVIKELTNGYSQDEHANSNVQESKVLIDKSLPIMQTCQDTILLAEEEAVSYKKVKRCYVLTEQEIEKLMLMKAKIHKDKDLSWIIGKAIEMLYYDELSKAK